MPFVGEHAARIVSPDEFEDFRRQNDRLAPGVDVIFGIRKKGEAGSAIQAIRFDAERFTVEQAKKWLEEHDFKAILFEPAITEEERQEAIREAVLPFKDLALADRSREWDGAEARRSVREWAGGEDLDFEKYAQAFVIVDGPRDNLGSYKLPIADIIDDKLIAVPRGIFAVAAVLQGARGGADLPRGDLQRAQGHVGRYYKKMELTPPWEKAASDGEQMSEAFHLEGTHWVDVPSSGDCPTSHPMKTSDLQGSTRCFTRSAARALSDAKMRRRESAGVTVNVHGFVGNEEELARQISTIMRSALHEADEPKNKKGWTVEDSFNNLQQLGRQYTREESNFAEKAPEASVACGACRFYLRHPSEEVGRCQLVEGPIPWFSTCDFYIGAAEEAAAVFAALDSDMQEGVKQGFGSPGGKSRLVTQILPFFPDHTKYVEPFAGGAALFFAKKPSDKEVLNDYDREIVHAYRAFKRFSAQELDKHANKFDWISQKERIKVAWRGGGNDGPSRLFRFLYGLRGSFSRNRKDVAPFTFGKSLRPKFSDKTHERMNSVMLSNIDYRESIRAHDGPNTFFFIDPPYPKEWPREKVEGRFELEPLNEIIRKIKGKFLLTVDKNSDMRKLFEGFNFKTIHRITTFTRPDQQERPDKRDMDEEYLISNFSFSKSSKWMRESAIPTVECR